MTVGSTATASAALEDIGFVLELAVVCGAREAQATGRKATCPICSQRVPTYEFRVPLLTSYGTAYVWRTSAVPAHRRACWTAHRERTKQAAAEHKDLDLWAP